MGRRHHDTLTAGVIRLRFELPAETLKEKRMIVRSLVDRLRARFNAAVVEAADLDDPGRATVAAVCLSNDVVHVQRQLQAILAAVEAARVDAVLADVETETLTL